MNVFFLAGAGFALSFVALIGLMRLLPEDFLVATITSRSNHVHRVRQIGGLGLAPVLVAALGAFPGDWPAAIALALGAIAIATLGFIDDWRDLSAPAKATGQAVIALAILVFLAGRTGLAFGPEWVVAVTAAAIAYVYWINAVNFMDGIDLMIVAGIAPGLALVSGLLLAASPDDPIAVAGVTLAGGLAAFGLFNRPPARIFLGDSGSLLTGFISGLVIIDALARLPAATAVLPFAFFLADTASTLVLRFARGEALWKAHSAHAYQVARRGGASVEAVISRVAVVTVSLCLLALLADFFPGAGWQVAALLTGAALAAIAVHVLRRAGGRSVGRT